MNTKKQALIVGVALIFALILFAVIRSYKNPTQAAAPQTTRDVAYLCSGAKAILAVYSDGVDRPAVTPGGPPIPGGSAKVTLTDGRTMALHQTISADGVRYANADESFVFWDKGGNALVLENGKEGAYTGCVNQNSTFQL